MRTIGATIVAIGFSLVGCQSQTDDGLVTAEHNELGIAQVEIDHGFVNGERMLTVRGLDDHGDILATATLRTGMVLYGADMPEEWNPGTELIIGVGELNQSYVSPDRVAHAEHEPYEASLASFVRLTAVSDAIADEAGIRFTRHSTEVAFAAANCNGANFPIGKGNPSQCCVDGTDLWHKSPTNTLANRTLGTACRDSAGNTGCTGAGCAWGPCGAKANGATGTAAAAVFTPTSAPTVCGRDNNGSAAGGTVEAPEAYTGAQSLKPGVTASCNYTQCVPSGSVAYRVTTSASMPGGNYGRISVSGSPTAGYPSNIDGYPGQFVADFPPGTVLTVSSFRIGGSGPVYITSPCTASGSNPSCQFTINADTDVHVGF